VAPHANYFLCAAKESNPRNAAPVYRPCGIPCVARLVRRLRNSHCVLKQSSPKSPDQPALLGGAQGMKSRWCGVRCAHGFVCSQRSACYAGLQQGLYSARLKILQCPLCGNYVNFCCVLETAIILSKGKLIYEPSCCETSR
jgi:hypothetical protein